MSVNASDAHSDAPSDALSSSPGISPATPRPQESRWFLLIALLLFLIWSNTFIGIGYLLGAEHDGARFDWKALTVARFLPVFPICLAYCLAPSRIQATRTVLARRWRRVVVAGLLAVPGYNAALYFGQQHGVPAPIASVTTTLAPIFILILSIWFLGERLTIRRGLGFLLCIGGMALISLARPMGSQSTYPIVVAVTALAPACWSVFSVITKPMMREVDSVHWTYLAIAAGSLPLVLVSPWIGGPELVHLDAVGWSWLLYLAILATVIGFALWTWLLRHLPASTVGLTVFLNPPLTTVSKVVLAAALPATFAFRVTPLEGLGGALVLFGLAVGVLQRPGGTLRAGRSRG